MGRSLDWEIGRLLLLLAVAMCKVTEASQNAEPEHRLFSFFHGLSVLTKAIQLKFALPQSAMAIAILRL
jgi:hypothetical protein